eukprot:m51a1_g2670 hypothetical protein (109) ;mRNA; f:716251-716577
MDWKTGVVAGVAGGAVSYAFGLPPPTWVLPCAVGLWQARGVPRQVRVVSWFAVIWLLVSAVLCTLDAPAHVSVLVPTVFVLASAASSFLSRRLAPSAPKKISEDTRRP